MHIKLIVRLGPVASHLRFVTDFEEAGEIGFVNRTKEDAWSSKGGFHAGPSCLRLRIVGAMSVIARPVPFHTVTLTPL